MGLPHTNTSGFLNRQQVVGLVFSIYVMTMYRSVPGGDSGELIVGVCVSPSVSCSRVMHQRRCHHIDQRRCHFFPPKHSLVLCMTCMCFVCGTWAAGCTMGIAHPPGYPLFTMLANLFHALPLPLASPAARINLLSVVLSTASAWFNYWTVLHWDAAMWNLAGPESTLGAPWTCKFWEWGVSVWSAVASSALCAFCPLIWMYSIQAEVRLTFALSASLSLMRLQTIMMHVRCVSAYCDGWPKR